MVREASRGSPSTPCIAKGVYHSSPGSRFDIDLLKQCLDLARTDAVLIVDQKLDITFRKSLLDRANNLARRNGNYDTLGAARLV
jgi:hypothetical protein